MAVRVTAGAFTIALPWGEETQWLRNVLAARECMIRWRGRDHRVTEPRVIGFEEAGPAFSRVQRALLRAVGVKSFLRLRRAKAGSPRSSPMSFHHVDGRTSIMTRHSLEGPTVGKLIYLLNVSLDGFIEAPEHNLDWATVDEELHSWFNDQMRSLDATLYGRRLYEVMAAHWPTAEDDPQSTEVEREFARIWNPMPKIVFSSSLERVDHNSRLVHGDVGEVLNEVRREFPGDLGVAGANLAGQFVRRGLVDEYQLVIHPVVLGAGTPYWPQLDQRLPLRLSETRTFKSGVMLASYAAA